MQTTITSASDLIAQKEALAAQEKAMIQELLDRRVSMTTEYEQAMTQIAADLKSLGYVRPRTKAESAGIEQGAKKRKKAA